MKYLVDYLIQTVLMAQERDQLGNWSLPVTRHISSWLPPLIKQPWYRCYAQPSVGPGQMTLISNFPFPRYDQCSAFIKFVFEDKPLQKRYIVCASVSDTFQNHLNMLHVLQKANDGSTKYSTWYILPPPPPPPHPTPPPNTHTNTQGLNTLLYPPPPQYSKRNVLVYSSVHHRDAEWGT